MPVLCHICLREDCMCCVYTCTKERCKGEKFCSNQVYRESNGSLYHKHWKTKRKCGPMMRDKDLYT